jgi:hypothetical protein
MFLLVDGILQAKRAAGFHEYAEGVGMISRFFG